MTNRRLIFWLAASLLLFVFAYAIRGILLPFVLGALTAYFLDPAADRLQQMKCSRACATSVITALFFVLVGMCFVVVIPTAAGQLSGLIGSLPAYIATLETTIAPKIAAWLGNLPAEQMATIKQTLANFSGIIASALADIVAGVFQSGMAFFNVLSLILITPLVTFYLLRDWDEIVARADALLPRKQADTIRTQCRAIDATLAGFIRGQVNVCLILAIYYGLGLSFIGLHFGLAIGVLTGLLAIVPYVGFALGGITGLAVAFFQFGFETGFYLAAAVFLLGQILEGYILTPKLVGSKVGLHPVWIIFGMLSGGALFGFVGVLIAIPVTAVIGVLIRFALEQYMLSPYYHG